MLNGVHEATVELGSYDDPAISVITYMELRSGKWLRPQDKSLLDAVLAEFTVLQLERPIVEAAIAVRGAGLVSPPKIKLPDAIIAATALSHGVPPVTRNGRDFIRVPVTIHTPYDYDSLTGAVSNVRAPFH